MLMSTWNKWNAIILLFGLMYTNWIDIVYLMVFFTWGRGSPHLMHLGTWATWDIHIIQEDSHICESVLQHSNETIPHTVNLLWTTNL